MIVLALGIYRTTPRTGSRRNSKGSRVIVNRLIVNHSDLGAKPYTSVESHFKRCE
jgi:hypothetical protein